MQKFCWCRRFGFTATPLRNQGDYKYFEALFGPILQQVSFQEALENGSVTDISYTFLPVCKKLDYLSGDKPDWLKQKLFYVSNKTRNNVIVQAFKDIQAADPDMQILIMTKSLAHLIILHQMLPECAFIHGDIGKLDRYKSQKALKDVNLKRYEQDAKKKAIIKRGLEKGTIKYAISTGVLEKGVNLHHLAALIRADGAVSGIPSFQIPGRLARLDKGKDMAYLIDIQDDFCTEAEERAKKREKEYKKRDWKRLNFLDILNQIKNNYKERIKECPTTMLETQKVDS